MTLPDALNRLTWIRLTTNDLQARLLAKQRLDAISE